MEIYYNNIHFFMHARIITHFNTLRPLQLYKSPRTLRGQLIIIFIKHNNLAFPNKLPSL